MDKVKKPGNSNYYTPSSFLLDLPFDPEDEAIFFSETSASF
jgi:hypothetical protein